MLHFNKDLPANVYSFNCLLIHRVYEKMMEKMLEVGASLTGMKRRLSVWAKKKGLQGNQNKQKK